MSEPIHAFDPAAVAESIRALCAMRLERFGVRCDWCRAPLPDLRAFDAYVEFCMSLSKIWPRTKKGLPPDKTFCGDCAAGAIGELIDGRRWAPDRQARFV
jgi:hypothetical protein